MRYSISSAAIARERHMIPTGCQHDVTQQVRYSISSAAIARKAKQHRGEVGRRHVEDDTSSSSILSVTSRRAAEPLRHNRKVSERWFYRSMTRRVRMLPRAQRRVTVATAPPPRDDRYLEMPWRVRNVSVDNNE